jgi:hypothetical protein
MTDWDQMTDMEQMAVKITNLKSAWAHEVLALELAVLETADAQSAVTMATTKWHRAMDKENTHIANADGVEREYEQAKAAYEHMRMGEKTDES